MRVRSVRPLATAAMVVVGSMVFGTVTTPVGGSTPSAAPVAETAKPAAGPTVTGTVTLLTGDRVRVSGDAGGRSVVSVEPGPGRQEIGFVKRSTGDGGLSVIPADTLGLVASGRLDTRLFDVTELLEAGYGDADRSDLPLIVSFDEGRHRAVAYDRTAAGNGWRALRMQLSSEAIERIWLDGPEHALLDESVRQTGDATRPDLADVTSDTSHDGPDGLYSGQVTATAGQQTVATAITVEREVESYDLTVRTLGTDGRPAASAGVSIFGLDVDAERLEYGGTVTVRLGAGTYAVDSTFYKRSAKHFYMMARPTVRLDHDMTITADARKTRPVTTTLAVGRDAKPVLVAPGYYREREGGRPGIDVGVLTGRFNVSTAQLGPSDPTDGMTGYVVSQWAKGGSVANRPYTYTLADSTPGEFFTGYQRRVTSSELAKVEIRRNAHQITDGQAIFTLAGYAPGMLRTAARLMPYDLPSSSIHYVDAQPVRWESSLLETKGIEGATTLRTPDLRTFQAGKTYRQRWNAAVFGPGWPTNPQGTHAKRTGDLIDISLPLYSDGAGHVGFSTADQAKTTLLRDGEQIWTSNDSVIYTEVEPGDAKYQVRTSFNRSNLSDFSTRTSVTWTFRSDTASQEGEVLPLWAVRFAPEVGKLNLNDDRGRIARVPVTLRTPPNADAGTITELSILASTDNGQTWKTVKVTPNGDIRYIAGVRTPDNAKYVSLRATAVDSDGNSVKQTIIHAYGLK